MTDNRLPPESGIYTLIIDATRPISIMVGKKGFRDFRQGFYTYTGSAVGMYMNLRTRVSRHLAFEKKRHWHIDYLLSYKSVSIRAVLFMETHLKIECKIAKKMDQRKNVKTLIKGFGSSDCRNGCASHLHYIPDGSLEKTILLVSKIYKEIFGEFPPDHILLI